MFVLRLLLILTALSIVITGGLYMFTRNRRYLNMTVQTVRFVVFALVIFFVLFVLERYVLAGWKVLV